MQTTVCRILTSMPESQGRLNACRSANIGPNSAPMTGMGPTLSRMVPPVVEAECEPLQASRCHSSRRQVTSGGRCQTIPRLSPRRLSQSGPLGLALPSQHGRSDVQDMAIIDAPSDRHPLARTELQSGDLQLAFLDAQFLTVVGLQINRGAGAFEFLPTMRAATVLGVGPAGTGTRSQIASRTVKSICWPACGGVLEGHGIWNWPYAPSTCR